MNKRLLSVEEAASHFSISPRTIYNEPPKGTFSNKPKKWGRRVFFDIRDLDGYVDALPHEEEDRSFDIASDVKNRGTLAVNIKKVTA